MSKEMNDAVQTVMTLRELWTNISWRPKRMMDKRLMNKKGW